MIIITQTVGNVLNTTCGFPYPVWKMKFKIRFILNFAQNYPLEKQKRFCNSFFFKVRPSELFCPMSPKNFPRLIFTLTKVWALLSSWCLYFFFTQVNRVSHPSEISQHQWFVFQSSFMTLSHLVPRNFGSFILKRNNNISFGAI